MSLEEMIQNLKAEALQRDNEVLEDVKKMIKRFVVLESEAYFDAATLYIAYTYLQSEFEIFPKACHFITGQAMRENPLSYSNSISC